MTVRDAPLIYDLRLDQLSEMLEAWEEPGYRASQIWSALYKELKAQPDTFTSLPKGLRGKLKDQFCFNSLSVKAVTNSEDANTRKLLFQTRWQDPIETVLMRYRQRWTACISTQSGCGIGCVFCATGQMGFQRNLSAGEIVEQVLYLARDLHDQGERLTNIVVMGMGEPFQNYEATLGAIDTLNNSEGFNFGSRRITISTVGIVPMIERFTSEKRRVNLAVSLHAATNQLRDKLIPINRRYPLENLLESCRQYVAQTRRRITFEWAMIRGVNDGLSQAKALADLIDDFLCHVNLIPLNPTREYAETASRDSAVASFQTYLRSRGISCTTRLRRGIEIQAGCGQLAAQENKNG